MTSSSSRRCERPVEESVVDRYFSARGRSLSGETSSSSLVGEYGILREGEEDEISPAITDKVFQPEGRLPQENNGFITGTGKGIGNKWRGGTRLNASGKSSVM